MNRKILFVGLGGSGESLLIILGNPIEAASSLCRFDPIAGDMETRIPTAKRIKIPDFDANIMNYSTRFGAH